MVRKYQLKQRAERKEETRRRIIQATVDLHTTLGPARTSVLAIAERAGVERPTVYRHFPTTEALFTACSSHYWAHNPAPNSSPWLMIADPKARMRTGLGEIYAYYSDREAELWNILRDLEDEPWTGQFATSAKRHRERVFQVLAAAWRGGTRSKRVAAVLGHAIDFFAWRSLRRQGLTNDEAVALMIDLADKA